MRRLKPTLGCNTSKERRRIRRNWQTKDSAPHYSKVYMYIKCNLDPNTDDRTNVTDIRKENIATDIWPNTRGSALAP